MDLFNFLKKIHDDCIELSKSIKFDKKHPRQLHLIGLYGSIVELSGCIITLIDEKKWIGIPSLFRSALEASVDLINLHANAEYGYFMEASYYSNWLKVLKEARKGKNPFLSEISKVKNLDLEIITYEKEKSSLKARGYIPLQIVDKFEKAGLINEYRSMYAFLSNDAHSNISSLIDRHYRIDGDDFKVVYYSDEPIYD